MQFVSSSGQNIYALQAPVPVRHQFTVLFHESGIEKGSHHADLVPSLRQRVSFTHQPRVVTRMGGAYQTESQLPHGIWSPTGNGSSTSELARRRSAQKRSGSSNASAHKHA